MYRVGDVIDERYTVTGMCSNAGGMGTVLFVTRKGLKTQRKRVLKYCKLTDADSINRFSREVRIMTEKFKGNPRVIQVTFSNLEHDPPYFVMPFYEDGDLSRMTATLQNDFSLQEATFIEMIECIAELHSVNIFHRDIKPQNFLIDGDDVVVSDFGLSTELDSSTQLTTTGTFGGTQGYAPPEFHMPGGFKNANEQSDIFMLGKTFYSLLTGRNPTYFRKDEIPTPLRVFIDRCCADDEGARFQTLDSMKRNLVAAYDVLLGRVVGTTTAARTLNRVTQRLEDNGNFRAEEVERFIEQLARLDDSDKSEICLDIDSAVFDAIAQVSNSGLASFLKSYEAMTEAREYGFAFAETIASNMRKIFVGDETSSQNKTLALKIAVKAADSNNRYAAMETCKGMVRSIKDDELAQHIHGLIDELSDTFLAGIEPSTCKSPVIKGALMRLSKK